MFRTTHTIRRMLAVSALAVAVAALVVPSALAGRIDGRSPDTRDAALAAQQTDFGARDGWYSWAASLDGRSPDTRDAASAAQQKSFGPPDGWYYWALALTRQQQQPEQIMVDGRSPDTIDAAVQAHAPIVTVYRSPGFAWGDFGIGIAAAIGGMLLAAGVATRMRSARRLHLRSA